MPKGDGERGRVGRGGGREELYASMPSNVSLQPLQHSKLLKHSPSNAALQESIESLLNASSIDDLRKYPASPKKRGAEV